MDEHTNNYDDHGSALSAALARADAAEVLAVAYRGVLDDIKEYQILCPECYGSGTRNVGMTTERCTTCLYSGPRYSNEKIVSLLADPAPVAKAIGEVVAAARAFCASQTGSEGQVDLEEALDALEAARKGNV